MQLNRQHLPQEETDRQANTHIPTVYAWLVACYFGISSCFVTKSEQVLSKSFSSTLISLMIDKQEQMQVSACRMGGQHDDVVEHKYNPATALVFSHLLYSLLICWLSQDIKFRNMKAHVR